MPWLLLTLWSSILVWYLYEQMKCPTQLLVLVFGQGTLDRFVPMVQHKSEDINYQFMTLKYFTKPFKTLQKM